MVYATLKLGACQALLSHWRPLARAPRDCAVSPAAVLGHRALLIEQIWVNRSNFQRYDANSLP